MPWDQVFWLFASMTTKGKLLQRVNELEGRDQLCISARLSVRGALKCSSSNVQPRTPLAWLPGDRQYTANGAAGARLQFLLARSSPLPGPGGRYECQRVNGNCSSLRGLMFRTQSPQFCGPR